MLGRYSGAAVVVLALFVAIRFAVADPVVTTDLAMLGEEPISPISALEARVLGIQASGAADKFGPGNTHPGRGLGLLKKDATTTTAPAAPSHTRAL